MNATCDSSWKGAHAGGESVSTLAEKKLMEKKLKEINKIKF